MNFVTPQTDPADAEPQKEERLKRLYDLSRFDADKNGSRCCEGCINMNEVKLAVNKASRSVRDCNKWKIWVKRRLPILDWLPNYKPKKYLVPDLMTGFTVGIMNIPQGLAYALLATLNPIYGLYVSFFPMIVYTLFGTCKHLIIGGVAIISLLTGTVIDEMVNEHFVRTNSSNSSTDEEHFRVEIACQLSLLVSLIHLFMGIIGLGFISAFFSDTFISGYTCGSAIHVVMSQLKDLFGIRKLTKYNGVFKIPKSLVDFLLKIHTSNWITLGFSIACVAFLVICKEFTNPLIKKRIHFEFPSELVLIIIMTSISYVADLKQNFNITIIENIPTGLPSPRVPQTTYLLPLLKGALLIASISFSVSISLAALYSRKKKYKIDPTQELYALGLSAFTGSFFSCYPIAGSLSRTSVVAESGGKTQLAAFFSSSVLVIVIIWLAPFLKTLPNLCLASVIIVALKGLLFQIRDLAPLWRINKYEFVTWLVTFLSVVLLDVDWGLFIGLGTSILVVIIRDQMAPLRPLVKPTNRMTLFREDFVRHDSDSDTQPIMRADKDIKVFKVEHSIYFANCKIFSDNIYKLNQLKPSQHHVQPSVLHQKDKSLVNVSANDTEDYDELNRTNAGVNNLNHEMPSSSSPSPAHDGPELIVRRASLVSRDQNHIQSPADTSLMISHDFILDFSAVNYIDTNGIQVIEELIDDFKNIGVFVYICRPQESFLRMICRLKLVDKFDSHVFLTIEDAIRHFNEQTV